jgi:protein-S-isoprenylcysteine O-methyltransferase Ste14
MNPDDLFRLILLSGLVLILPIGAYHRLRSQASGERLDRRQEGLFLLVSLRPLALVFGSCILAFLIDPAWLSWSALALPAWLRWVGVGSLALAAALLVWTFRHLGTNLTDTVVTRKHHSLVTTGPYRWVRHPFYVVSLLGSVGVGLMAANWFLLVAGVLIFLLLRTRTRIEEEKLVERFGDEYRQYMGRTGRFIPRLWG